MGLCISTTSRLRSTKRIDQGAISRHTQSTEGIDQGATGGELQPHSPLTVSIHILDDDSLLNVFYLYRPFLLGEDHDIDDPLRLTGGKEGWGRGRWWYKIAHVCRRWRNVVLGSAPYLGVSLVCTNGTPVADMLGHSPPLSLVIDYTLDEDGDISAEDENEAILALKRYNRVRRVRIRLSVTSIQKVVVAMADEYPVMEYLIIGHPVEDDTAILMLPETFQAPHLRHLVVFGLALPIGSRLLTTTPGLVTLCLFMVHPSTYVNPNTLLQWLSFMPQLETLAIAFEYPVPNCEVERQLSHMSMTTPVILPNLHVFRFFGAKTYLEALVHRITAPRLEKLQLEFFNQLTFSFPGLLQLVNTTENLTFKSAKFEFSDENVDVKVYPYEDAEMYALSISVKCCHFDWQVSSAAQIFHFFRPFLSTVEHLTLEYGIHSQSSEEHNEADPSEWHKLLDSFRNVKTLNVAEGLVNELSRYLQLYDGELSLDVLPELQELSYSGSGDTDSTFTPFINSRQDAGRPIILVRSQPKRHIQNSSVASTSDKAGSDVDA